MNAIFGHSERHTAGEALRLINQLYANQILEGTGTEVRVRVEFEKEDKAS